jgi:Cdc6-like AAA superfamily ATPase
MKSKIFAALKLPKIHVPPPLGQHVHAHFVERPDIMNTIDECFFKKQVTSKDSPDIYRLLLFGLPGSGKSQMAHHFFQQSASREAF